MALYMVLRLYCNEGQDPNKPMNVAVPLDKDLGSPETSAAIATAFGVSAGRAVESIKATKRKRLHGEEIEYMDIAREVIPLNINWHDLEHPANAHIKGVLFDGQHSQWKVEVKFGTVQVPTSVGHSYNMATRMVLCLSGCDHKGRRHKKNVAVPLDKALGSPETSAEIVSAFGLSATRVKTLTARITRPNHGGVSEHNIPLELNWHDLAHPANVDIKGLLFDRHDVQWSVWVNFTEEKE